KSIRSPKPLLKPSANELSPIGIFSHSFFSVDRPKANNGLRHIYLDGRKLPPQDEPQPWWYGYSVGHWEGDTLVVETNNLRGAEDGPSDGWLDVTGSPCSEQAKFTERFRRLSFDHMEIDLTLEDPKAYTKPCAVRIDQRLIVD